MSPKPRKENALFDVYVKSISHTKDEEFLSDPDFDQTYSPWVVNRAFSYHEDAVLTANTMNRLGSVLESKLQALVLLNMLRPRKRYAKWITLKVPDDVKMVAEYYGCSVRRARELVSLHSSEQLKYIKTRLEKGGVNVADRGPTYERSD